MESIVQTEKECYISQSTTRLHKHHVYGGYGVRNLSEKYGLWIWLRADWHIQTPYAIHNNKPLRERIQREVQEIAMKHYGWSVDDFRQIFGRSFL